MDESEYCFLKFIIKLSNGKIGLISCIWNRIYLKFLKVITKKRLKRYQLLKEF